MKRTRSTADIIIFKRCRAKARRIILEAKQSSWLKCCISISCNYKLSMTWKKIKCFSGNRAFLHIPILNTTELPVPTTNTANILANHFATISGANYTQQFSANQHRSLPTLHKAVIETLPKHVRFNANFSLSKVKFGITSTGNTSPGADNICYEMFKHMSDTSLQVLLSLYNSISKSGAIPQSWTHPLVVPIPKPNKPSYLPSSYRPISLTS